MWNITKKVKTMTANTTRTSKGPKSSMKIAGLKKVISELNACPEGYHYEVIGKKKNDGSYEVWTSDLLSQGWWAVVTDTSERCLLPLIMENRECGRSWSESIKMALLEAW